MGGTMAEVRSSRTTTEKAWWSVIVAMGVTAFVLGVIGYRSTYIAELNDAAMRAPSDLDVLQRQWSWSDAVFNSLGLFFFNSPPYTDLHLTLDIARYLAYGVTLAAGATALVALFNERYQAWRLRKWKGHIVVCGLGYKGLTFIQNLHDAHKIVVVESDPDNPAIESCRALGIPVIIGDARNEDTLRRARLEQAERLLAVCPGDAINTEILLNARSIVEDGPQHGGRERNRGTLRCLAQINHPQLCAMLSDTQIWEEDEAWTADFFNTNDTAATLILDDHPVGTGGEPPHLVVAHLAPLGQRLVVLAAQRWLTSHGDDEHVPPMAITLIDAEVGERVKDLKRQYASLRDGNKFIFFTASPSARDVADLRRQWEAAGVKPPVRTYVTSADDDECVATALTLLGRLNVNTEVIVALSREHGTGKMLHASPRVDVVVFPTFERTCTRELLFDVSTKRLAKEIHRIWREEQRTQKEKLALALAKLDGIADDAAARAVIEEALAIPEESPREREVRKATESAPVYDANGEPRVVIADVEVLRAIQEAIVQIDATHDERRPLDTVRAVVAKLTDDRAGIAAPSWDEASDDDRASSLAQAHDIALKLRGINASIQPLGSVPERFEFTEDEIGRLAEHEHARWNAERQNTGWTLGPKDKLNKVTPYLVPFEDLPWDVAEWDRVFVRKIPRILERAGYMAVRGASGATGEG